MAKPPKPPHEPKFTATDFKKQCREIQLSLVKTMVAVAELDWLGDARQLPGRSEECDLAMVRDEMDEAFGRLIGVLVLLAGERATKTRSQGMLLHAISVQQGDGPQTLELMRRYHALFGDEPEPDENPPADTCPDAFAWDTYLRVSALAKLAEAFPKHVRHSASQMHGWPMIVSHHVDHAAEFERLAQLLDLGADYPLDVGPRKRRGTETPLLRYLEPLIWRVHVARKVLAEATARDGSEADFWRPDRNAFFDTLEPRPEPEEEAILDHAAALQPLTQKTAKEWSQEVIVPLIMVRDAGTSETCKVPALKNIWKHQAVKSRATFRSRLHSAVTDTLQRFGRPG